MAAAASSALVFSSAGNRSSQFHRSRRQHKNNTKPPLSYGPLKSFSVHRKALRLLASVSMPELQNRSRRPRPGYWKSGTDRGVSLKTTEHKQVGEIAEELQKFCVDAPLNCEVSSDIWSGFSHQIYSFSFLIIIILIKFIVF